MEALSMIGSTSTSESRAALGKDAILAIDVGNCSIALGAWEAMKVAAARRVPNADREGFATAFAELCSRFADGRPAAVVVASVVPAVLPWIQECTAAAGYSILVIGRDVPLPSRVAVREPSRVGADRVCAAAAAFERTGHACTVVDFGTAITVDLVDDEGTFVGGAILPGPALQAKALADGTAGLPQVELVSPERAIGRDTVEAIRSGILNGVAGAVRGLVEQYATELNTWPQVVATGGGLQHLLDRCDFIDTAVADLTLMGVGLAYARHREALALEAEAPVVQRRAKTRRPAT